ncbi:hypothetical protein Caci_2978 [Catenulispora acidiphila DSM 44928]|uniref:Uncharacterized protein n=1 Tax=Catenulispora acidiphila (strain DSM 44928 / JCM 14897 / NBRC 102108 / NRRL B-24433 / ID139908) TaxID=479433 RepID=C7Q2Z5_CATAD|nr:hypothetical protein [Catenulispora acidiphila]ACU71887.1 hypothetical protein Caci_2978 [Catenulispora acidiphila DSM 44928]
MPDRITLVRMREIDYILRFPGRFTKADIREAALELRAEINLLDPTVQRTVSSNPRHEGTS